MSYVYAGYGVTVAAIALYAVRVLLRGRALRRALLEERDS
jgi:heme exporter protein D